MKELDTKAAEYRTGLMLLFPPDTMEQAVQQSTPCCGRITKLICGAVRQAGIHPRQLKLSERSKAVPYADGLTR